MIHVGHAADAPAFPDAARRGARQPASCAPTSATPPTSSAASARSSSAKPPTGRRCANPAGRSRRTCCAISTTTSSSSRQQCTRAGGHVHWARDADEANRLIVGIIQSHGETEVIKVKTMTSDETRLNAALEAAGITPYETDLADLIIQLGHDRPSHIVVPALHRNRDRDPRAVPADDAPGRAGPRARGSRPRRAAVPAREVPARQGRLQRRELRDRRHRRGLRRRVRGQRPDVRDAAARARDARRDREDRPVDGRSRGVPAAAAALGDRRADEPVQLDLDRHPWRGRPGGVPRRPARQRPHQRAGRSRGARDAALHPLRGVPQRLPGVPPDRRPRLRVDLQRSDRRDPDAAAPVHGALDVAALCLVLVRRVLRGVSGQDQHPGDPDSPAPPDRRGANGRGPRASR